MLIVKYFGRLCTVWIGTRYQEIVTDDFTGSPGVDRVIINSLGKLDGKIKHTGASGNNLLGCRGASQMHILDSGRTLLAALSLELMDLNFRSISSILIIMQKLGL